MFEDCLGFGGNFGVISLVFGVSLGTLGELEKNMKINNEI
jgi:hypothetical protein